MTTKTKRSKLGLMVNAGMVALAFGLLGLVIWRNADKIREVFSRPIDARMLAIAQVIFLMGILSTFIRWYLLVRVIDPRFTIRAAVLLGFIGNVFNLVIPGAVGGDLIKAAYLAQMHVKKTQAIASMVIDRILGLLGLFALASIAGALIWDTAPPDIRRLILAAWVVTVLGLLVLAAIFSQAVTRMFPGLGRGHSRLALITTELKEMSSTYRRRLDLVGVCGLMAMGNHTLNVLAFYLVGRMLYPGMPTTLGQHFLLVPLTLFTMAVPLPFGALGLTEGVADQLFDLVKHPSGFLAMMGFRVLIYGSGLVGAIVYLARLKEVRGLTASAHQIEEEIAAGDLEELDAEDGEGTPEPAQVDGDRDTPPV